jgi:hypothetical protein
MGGKREKEEFFYFQEPGEMRINIQDLKAHPGLFRVDLQEHKIYLSQAGRSSFQKCSSTLLHP